VGARVRCWAELRLCVRRRRSRGGCAAFFGRGGASAELRRCVDGSAVAGERAAETDVVRRQWPCWERLLAAIGAAVLIGAAVRGRAHPRRLRPSGRRFGSGCTVLAWGAGGASIAARLSGRGDGCATRRAFS
jgi:hypothetical protein